LSATGDEVESTLRVFTKFLHREGASLPRVSMPGRKIPELDSSWENSGGFRLRRLFRGARPRDAGPGLGLRGAGAQVMNVSYLVSGVLALALLVYLLIALLRAEDL
jgi:K+-transporting ATPase KdpF subunit